MTLLSIFREIKNKLPDIKLLVNIKPRRFTGNHSAGVLINLAIKSNTMPAKQTIEEMQAIARSKGGRCLSPVYMSASTKLKWKCAERHTWEATPYDVKNKGAWCPACAGLDEMRDLAASKGGICLSPAYLGAWEKLKWECRKGHIWWAEPANIKNTGVWCPACARRVKGTLEEMQAIAISKGGKCLSPVYMGLSEELQWECDKGHTWWARPDSIKSRGSWCAVCSGKAKPTIEEMQTLALSKGGKCLSSVYKNSGTKLQWECSKGHTWMAAPNTIKNIGKWCPVCAGGRIMGTIEDMETLARSKGGKCLSLVYLGLKTKLQWECGKGHIWLAAPRTVKNMDKWCRVCAGKTKRNEKENGTIEEMKAFARSKGGKCLSPVYEGPATKLLWECDNGHTWRATPNTIKNMGRWCPDCAGIAIRQAVPVQK